VGEGFPCFAHDKSCLVAATDLKERAGSKDFPPPPPLNFIGSP